MSARGEYGEAAFYGPKLDFMVKDAIEHRRWQLSWVPFRWTITCRAFELNIQALIIQKHRPVMIHRAPFGSMERFVAVLIEQHTGW